MNSEGKILQNFVWQEPDRRIYIFKSGQVRVIYFVKKQDAIYLLHAFRKKTRELPRKELDVILKRLKEV